MLSELIFWTARILTWLIVADAILTWFPSMDRRSPLVVMLRRITRPIYEPIRRIIPQGRSGIDFSPLIAILLIQVIASILLSLLARAG